MSSAPPNDRPGQSSSDSCGAPTQRTGSTRAPQSAGGGDQGPPEHVLTALRTWQRRLVDAGGPNTLLWFDDTPGGALDLTTAHPGGVSMLMAGRATRLSDLVRERSAFADARRRAEAIRHKTLELEQERGLAAGFMAIGMATWNVPGARRAPVAPVLLRGCTLSPTDPSHRDYDIDLSAAVEINPVLAHYLSSEQGIDIDPEAVAALAHSARRFDPMPVFRELARMCRGVPGFRIADRKILAPFFYAKLPLVADLVAHGPELAGSSLVGELAGVSRFAAGAVGAASEPASMSGPTRPQPATETGRDILVLGTDAQQRQVIDAVRAGSDVSLDAPAGTGRTQTIAGAVAALLADGKRVLVVSEPATPLRDLAARLTEVGLDHEFVHVGEGGLDRGRVALAVRETVDSLQTAPREPDIAEVFDGLAARAGRLEAHRDALHSRREPWGVTVFEGLAALARLTRPRRPPTSRVRLTGDVLTHLDRPAAQQAGDLLTRAAAAGAWAEERRKDPWAGARITDEQSAALALQSTRDLSTHQLEEDRAALDGLLASVGLAPARVPDDWGTAIGLLEGVRATLAVLHPEVFTIDLLPFLGATGDAHYRRENDLRQSWGSRLMLRRRTREFVRDGAGIDDVHRSLALAHEQSVTWRRLSGGSSTPRVPDQLPAARERWGRLDDELRWLAERLTPTAEGGDLHGTPLEELRIRLARLAGRCDRLEVLPRVVPLLDEIGAVGLGPLADDLAARRVGPEFTGAEMDFVWWRSVLDEVARTDERIGGHDAVQLRADIGDYETLDAACQRGSVDVVLARHAAAVREVVGDHRDQLRIVQSEASRAGGHLSVDALVQAAPELVLTARPVWLLSPLVVASALPPRQLFDVVIVEDAGRLDPAHVVSAFARARQVLLVGDSRQLAPRPFTTSVSRSSARRTEPVPSLLEMLGPALEERTLDTHYRSNDERLVEFANEHVYDRCLHALPGAGAAGSHAVRLVVVEAADDEPGSAPTQRDDRGEEVPDLRDVEAARVVDLVVQHAVMSPQESVAVGCLDAEHALRLLERLRARLDTERDPDVVDFFEESRPEPVLVVPIDELQGHSRDALYLSIGVDPIDAGEAPLGVLAEQEGPRALAAALTTARRRLTVVSSVAPEELAGRLRSRGATLLRELLEHCARQGRPALHERAETRVDFRAEAPAGPADPAEPAQPAAASDDAPAAGDQARGVPVADQPARGEYDPVLGEFAVRLRQEGLVVHERYGEGGTPIDLVVEDPHHPGHAVVAVESDGPRYAAIGDTRERELQRPARLRALGWEYVGVCSADIFADPARDVARVLDAVRAADARSWSTRPRTRGGRRGAPTVGSISGRGTTGASFEGVALEAVAPEPAPEPTFQPGADAGTAPAPGAAREAGPRKPDGAPGPDQEPVKGFDRGLDRQAGQEPSPEQRAAEGGSARGAVESPGSRLPGRRRTSRGAAGGATGPASVRRGKRA